MKAKNALSLVLAAGVVTPALADLSPAPAPKGTMATERVAHIYYNVATGEKVATMLNSQVRPVNDVSTPVWTANNDLPCAAFGQTGGTAGIIDDPNNPDLFTSTATGQIILDWGDVAPDTVVDCIITDFATQIEDVDTGMGAGAGVVGFGAVYAVFDAENGFDSAATRLDLAAFIVDTLPGDVPPNDPNLLAVYELTLDLVPDSFQFEIGDTDSVDGSGNGNFNPGSGADLDTDGLADFGYALQFIQPGTFDFDNADGDDDTSTGVDGDENAQALTGWGIVVGDGEVSADGNTYTNGPGDTGAEDAFDVLIDDTMGGLENLGTFFYLGFGCDLDGNGTFEPGDNSNPFAQHAFQLLGPGGPPPCGADLFPVGAGDGSLNFFDLNQYLALFNAGDLAADFFPAAAGDGLLNFFDLNQYLAEFNAGCP